MATQPLPITRLCRARSYDSQNIIDAQYSMRLCERHFGRSDTNYVEINGRLCWNLYQAECRIREHFKHF